MATTKENLKSGLTCLTCRLVFSDGEVQRQHYASEFHLYNVKRQVAGLPPITANEFELKLQQLSQNKSNTASNDLYCSNCSKKFQSIMAYENHCKSKKHKENLERSAKHNNDEQNLCQEEMIHDNSAQNKADAEPSVIPINKCLFCSSLFKKMETSLEHMSNSHGFYIPDFQYCSDLPGLLEYLGWKVGAGKTCLRCNSNRFEDSLQKHMRDKNHCNFRIDEVEECLLEFMDFYDYNEMYENEDTPENTVLYDDGSFLTLPSGAKIGHRLLFRYFKQSLKPVRDEQNISRKQLTAAIKMKQLGWTGLTGQLHVQHAKDVTFLKRTVQHYRLKQGMTNNKLFVTKGRKDQM